MRPFRYILLLAIASVPTLAQGTSGGVSSLKIPQNAIIGAQGATAVSLQGSLGAVPLNPASVLTDNSALLVMFTHSAWLEGTTTNHLTVSLPAFSGRAYMATGMYVVPDIEVRTQPGPASSVFSARTAYIGAGWGTPLFDGILFGVAASYMYDRLYDTEATGISGSAGVLATGLMDHLRIGASVTELGSMSGYGGSGADLPTRVTLGAAYEVRSGDITVIPALSYQRVRNGASGVHAGAMVRYSVLSLRATLRSGETTQSGSFGAAVTYRGISLDYALVPFSEGWGSAHIMSIGLEL